MKRVGKRTQLSRVFVVGVIRIIQVRFRVPAARMSLQSRRGPTYYPF